MKREYIAVVDDRDGATSFVSTEPIVRCKDCKHWNDFYSKCTKWTVDTYEQAQTNADDFCSYGERKGNEQVRRI